MLFDIPHLQKHQYEHLLGHQSAPFFAPLTAHDFDVAESIKTHNIENKTKLNET